MNLEWNDLEHTTPPEGKILLVYGSLGIDLAMRVDGHWYYKCGDNWTQKNLEYWYNFTPAKWAEFNFPEEFAPEKTQHEEQKTDIQAGRNFLPDTTQSMHGLTELILMTWL